MLFQKFLRNPVGFSCSNTLVTTTYTVNNAYGYGYPYTGYGYSNTGYGYPYSGYNTYGTNYVVSGRGYYDGLDKIAMDYSIKQRRP